MKRPLLVTEGRSVAPENSCIVLHNVNPESPLYAQLNTLLSPSSERLIAFQPCTVTAAAEAAALKWCLKGLFIDMRIAEGTSATPTLRQQVKQMLADVSGVYPPARVEGAGELGARALQVVVDVTVGDADFCRRFPNLVPTETNVRDQVIGRLRNPILRASIKSGRLLL